MKKMKIAGVLLSAFTLSALASCNKEKPVDPEPTPEVVKNTVSFETNGGSTVQKIEVEANSKLHYLLILLRMAIVLMVGLQIQAVHKHLM